MVALMVVALLGYTKVMARISLVEPPVQAADALLADHLIVSKADRRLYLMQDGRVLKSYDIAMGARWDGGPSKAKGMSVRRRGTTELTGATRSRWRTSACISLIPMPPTRRVQRRADTIPAAIS